MTKGLHTVISFYQDTTEVQCTRHREFHCIAGKFILCKQTEGFGQYVLNFLFVSMIQNVILFSAFHCSLSSKEEI